MSGFLFTIEGESVILPVTVIEELLLDASMALAVLVVIGRAVERGEIQCVSEDLLAELTNVCEHAGKRGLLQQDTWQRFVDARGGSFQ